MANQHMKIWCKVVSVLRQGFFGHNFEDFIFLKKVEDLVDLAVQNSLT